MRPDLSQEKIHGPVFAFSPSPYLFFLLLIIRKKRESNEREERWGADKYTEESREGKENTLLLGGKND